MQSTLSTTSPKCAPSTQEGWHSTDANGFEVYNQQSTYEEVNIAHVLTYVE